MHDGAERALPLEGLEQWFQAEIVRPHESVRGARRDATATLRARDVIRPGRFLKPDERVAIYSRMYFLRLLECLTADYPSVRALCGDEGFERVVRAYLRRHPSRHYSLNALGQSFPDFLSEPMRLPRRALIADVARLERAMSNVFDAYATRTLQPADLAELSSVDWERVHLRLSPALELHAFAYRANAIVTATRKDESWPDLGRSPTWTVVYRKDFVVWRMDLVHPMYAILQALAAGESLRTAIEAGARRFTGTVEELQGRMFQWFGEWVSEGFFADVEMH